MLPILMALAAAPGAGAAPDFERDVKPVLERSCYACHNPALRNADLDLASFETEAKVLPVLVVGGANGMIQGGRHLVVPSETPMTNLYLTLLDHMGVAGDSLGDSTGRLAL